LIYSRDTILERSHIRAEDFATSKLKLATHQSEEQLSKLKGHAKELRMTQSIELESIYITRIDGLEEKIEQQTEEIDQIKNNTDKASSGKEIMLKILQNQQNMKNALLGYNQKKSKTGDKLKLIQKHHQSIYLKDNLEFDKLMSNIPLNDSIQRLKELTNSHPNAQLVEDIITQLHEVETVKNTINRQIDLLSLQKLTSVDNINSQHVIDTQKIKLES